jgi:uncharacterized protein YllA (UPF0747 family)
MNMARRITTKTEEEHKLVVSKVSSSGNNSNNNNIYTIQQLLQVLKRFKLKVEERREKSPLPLL